MQWEQQGFDQQWLMFSVKRCNYPGRSRVSRLVYTYEAVLVPGFVSSAGTARGAKQLVLTDVDFSPYSLLATLPLQEKHVMHPVFVLMYNNNNNGRNGSCFTWLATS